MVKNIKIFRRTALLILFLCYLTATLFESDFWGDLLSPIVAFVIFIIVFYSLVIKGASIVNKFVGITLSASILAWIIADVLWAVSELVLQVNPDEVLLITVLYGLPNLFITITLTTYGLSVLRKWNIIQMVLDSVVMSYLIVSLLWIIFLKEDFTVLAQLGTDPVSFASIIMDVLIIIWIVIWYVAVRSGNFPTHIRFIVAGTLIYALTDLVYYYQYTYSTYDPNTLLDAVYMFSFFLIGVGALVKLDHKTVDDGRSVFNIGRKGKTYFLLIAPLLVILFRGFQTYHLMIYVTLIFLYSLFSMYIQDNIYREELLKEEQELNNSLELKVKERTEELEENNRVLQHLIDQDYITGLFNRRYLLAYLEEMSGSLKDGESIVLLYIDINRYKMITTMFGHYIGEKILYEMAIRMKPLEDQVSRCILASYGDDAYIFAAVGSYDYRSGYNFAEDIIALCSDIYHIDGFQIRITANIGISIFPYDAANKEDLIKHADIAMTQARMKGFNMIQEFDVKLSEVIMRRNNIEIMLKKANFAQEFVVYYQPQLEVESKKIIGFEALLRWRTPSGEFISPGEFIPVAEETGYIIPVGDWVMKSVMKQLVDWNRRLKKTILIGINVSIRQLNTSQFLDSLREEINRLQINPEWIDLEITESLQLVENPDVVKMLEEIRQLGIKISIDDFGTGYSSLSYFKELPTDRIKLAKELIDYIHTDDFDYQLVKSMIVLAHAKGIRVIAEGVETKEQWETLRELSCDEVQGFYFGRPVPVEEIEASYGNELFDEKH